jgi:hypothetical protein
MSGNSGKPAEDAIVKTAALVAVLSACVAAAQVDDRVAGLLSLPRVFGSAPCDRFTPKDIVLYASPDSRRAVGSIRVEKNWTFAERGGCEGLVVKVHKIANGGSSDLPTREYGYEEPGAVVLQQRPGWFKVRLTGGAAWIPATDAGEFFTLERLLTDSLAYLTEAFDGRLSPSPGATRTARVSRAAEAGSSVRVRGFRRADERLWIQVEVLSDSPCTSAEEPKVVGEGWLPAHGKSGEPAVWFYSRGC